MTEIRRIVEWVKVAGKWTKYSIMGLNLDERNLELKQHDNDKRVAILMIPGNPGNEGYYAHFGREILKNLQEKHGTQKDYLFYTVSSLNHVRMPDHLNGRDGHVHEDRFSLEDQVEHKLNFVKEYLPKASEIYIFGHSIGSYMMLRILPEVIKSGYNVKKAVALFPTIEHMATSPNGTRLQSILATLNHYDCLTQAITFWVDYLPDGVKRFLIRTNLRSSKTPVEIVDATMEILYMHVFRNIVHMSNDELNHVKELDETLLVHHDIIHFYYGLKDGWCPVNHGYAMLERLGEHKVTLDEHDCEHAFVITEGDIMAKNVIKYFD